jgi:hypothetical protein
MFCARRGNHEKEVTREDNERATISFVLLRGNVCNDNFFGMFCC